MKILPLTSSINIFHYAGNNRPSPDVRVKKCSAQDAFCKTNDMSFGSNTTIASKLNTFVPEIYRYILSAPKIDYEGIESIMRKVSPETAVKAFSDIPRGANVCDGTGAYFHCNFIINTNCTPAKVIPNGKAIYIPLPKDDNVSGRLNLLGSVVHESTHIFQEESFDRISKCEFLSHFLSKDVPDVVKRDTLMAIPRIFADADFQMQQPYLRYFGMTDWVPRPVKYINNEGLGMIFAETAQTSVNEYLARSIVNAMDKYAKEFPNYDRKTILNYITQTAKKEREAYLNSVNVLKFAKNMEAPTDLDYRILLYDRFINIAAAMEELYGKM